MEIGDIFVINKCDRPGVENMERAVLSLLSLAHRPDGWTPPIIKTIATEGRGIEELVEAIQQSSEHAQTSSLRTERRRDAARQRLMNLLREQLVHKAVETVFPGDAIENLIDRIIRRETDPYSIADAIVRGARFES
jgi:LAO/AO transport system kinase